MTVAAVAISMALLVSMLSIAEGILYHASMGIQESERDIIISSDVTHGISNGHELVESLKADKNISAASAHLITDNKELLALNVTDPDSGNYTNYFALAVGIVPENEYGFLGKDRELKFRDIIDVKFEDWFGVGDDPHYENDYTGPWTYELIINDAFAEKHKLSIGSEVGIDGHRFHITGTFSTAITGEGISEIMKDFALVVMHLSELQSLLNITDGDEISSISLSLTDDQKDLDSARKIATDLKDQFPFYSVMTKEDRLKSIENQLSLGRLFYTAIGSVSLIIGLLFVACIMIMSIFERTNEFGMMRAIGISKRTIFIQTIFESMVIVMIGAFIGLIFGFFGSQALGDYLKTTSGIEQEFTVFTPQLLVQSLLIIVIFGTIISLYPAWKAARKNILEALRFIR
jgi:ABC-type antimicrobial peptide transport system permease subunit